jgi:hypothetical protein
LPFLSIFRRNSAKIARRGVQSFPSPGARRSLFEISTAEPGDRRAKRAGEKEFIDRRQIILRKISPFVGYDHVEDRRGEQQTAQERNDVKPAERNFVSMIIDLVDSFLSVEFEQLFLSDKSIPFARAFASLKEAESSMSSAAVSCGSMSSGGAAIFSGVCKHVVMRSYVPIGNRRIFSADVPSVAPRRPGPMGHAGQLSPGKIAVRIVHRSDQFSCAL